MKVKDVVVHFDLYGGSGVSTVWEGYKSYAGAFTEVECFPVHGKQRVLRELQQNTFIQIGDKIYNVKEVKSVSFGNETEREVT